MKRTKMENQIRKAREKLRDLHKKYQKEFFDINKKIDTYLETIENANQ